MDPLKNAYEHDKKLNVEEIKIIEYIKKDFERLKNAINEMEALLEELEDFNIKELDKPLLKEDEYKILIKTFETQKLLNNSIMDITQDLLKYKMLLDGEIF
ncbi:MAG: hypothetical protein ACP5GJ_03340 [Nanopusillaceae archaeon]|jgi:hypothetical protein